MKGLVIERIYEDHIKFGRLQYLYLIIFSLIELNDGIELIIMSINLPIIKSEFNLNSR